MFSTQIILRRPDLFNELEILLREAYPLIDDKTFRRAVQYLHICDNASELLVLFDPLADSISNTYKKKTHSKEDLKDVRKTVGQEPSEERCLEEQKEDCFQEPFQEWEDSYYHKNDPLGSLLLRTFIYGNI